MKLRAIQNGDLKVTKSWTLANGKERVHVSLKGASFVNKSFWIHPDQQAAPETIERVKRDLQAALERKVKGLERYLAR